MKKSPLLTTVFSILVLAFSANCYAEDLAAKVSALEEKAQRVQSLIQQAKASSQNALDNQLQGLHGSVDALMKQRVTVDAQIARLEGQISELKSQAQTSLNRQVGNYSDELQKIKSELAGMLNETNKQKKSEVKAQPGNPPNTDASKPAAKK